MAFRWTSGRPARHATHMSMLLAFLAGLTTGVPGWAATVERVDVHDGRITIRFDEAVRGASSFILNAPQRIAVDIDGARPGRASGGDGPVTAVRQGWRGADGARVVLDLAEPMIVSKGEFQDDGRTMELSLRPVDSPRLNPLSYMSRISSSRSSGFTK